MTPARSRWLGGSVGIAVSVAAHLAVLLVLIWQTPAARPPLGTGPVTVALLEGPPRLEPPSPPAPPEPPPPKPAKAKAKPAKPKAADRTAPTPRRAVNRSTLRSPTPDGAPSLAATGPSEAELAQAATAASAPRAGACNMTQLVQTALRSSRRAQVAMAGAHQSGSGRAVMVWNGAWVRNSGEDGGGLAGLREIMITEIAFAPQACRAQAMHGLVLISLADGPAAPRVVLGAGDWRWSDLLMINQGQ